VALWSALSWGLHRPTETSLSPPHLCLFSSEGWKPPPLMELANRSASMLSTAIEGDAAYVQALTQGMGVVQRPRQGAGMQAVASALHQSALAAASQLRS